MRIWIILCLCAGCSAGVPSEKIQAPQGDAAKPSAETTDGLVHDFEHMLSGERKRHRFEIVNSSAVAAEIERVSTSCSCTVASFTELPVPPGGVFNVDMDFHAPAAPGRISKVVNVYFKGERLTPIRLVVTSVSRALIDRVAGLSGAKEAPGFRAGALQPRRPMNPMLTEQ